MTAATFGELAEVASGRLRAAVVRMPTGGMEPGAVAGTVVGAGQVVHALTRYLDDLIGADEVEALLGQDVGGARRAAAHAREALAMAGACLGWAGDTLAVAGTGAALAAVEPDRASEALGPAVLGADLVAAELGWAAAAMIAGRDLLGMHIAGGDPGDASAASPWSAVVASELVAEALADQAGRWSGQLAMWTGSLLAATSGEARIGSSVRQDLDAARRWLQTASAATGATGRDPGQLTAGQMLLCAIPANVIPEARPLVGPEPDPALCDGIAVSAARLRALACASPAEGGWAPELTAESWWWAATATAIISDMSELLLSALAERADGAWPAVGPGGASAGTGPDADPASKAGHAGEPGARPAGGASPGEEPARLVNVADHVAGPIGIPPADGGSPSAVRQLLPDAAQAAAIACDRWREVVALWGQLTTETTGLTAPGVADIGDLVIRLGRLTFADPLWAPARSRRALPRDSVSFAPGKEQALAVLAAAHDAADALAAKSAADLRDVEAATRGGRLHVPTSTLPEYYDIPRPYGPAMPASTRDLVEAYRQAVTASESLVVALDAVAVQVGTASQVLALARAVVSPAAGGRADRGTDDQHEDTLTIPVPGEIGPKTMMPGPVERQVRAVGAADPMLLLRARAIDKAVSKAAQELITQAQDVLRQSGASALTDTAGQPRPSANGALAVAAQSFPHSPRIPAIGDLASDGSPRQTRTDRSDVRHRPACR